MEDALAQTNLRSTLEHGHAAYKVEVALRLELAANYADELERRIREYASMWHEEAIMIALSRRERTWLLAWRAVGTAVPPWGAADADQS